METQVAGSEVRRTICVSCDSALIYPKTYEYLACPTCGVLFSPSRPDRNFVVCVGCNILLEHDPSCIKLQCPKCSVVMIHQIAGEVEAVRKQAAAAAAAAAAPPTLGSDHGVRYGRCLTCSQFMSFPSSATIIQCPSEKCERVMMIQGSQLKLKEP